MRAVTQFEGLNPGSSQAHPCLQAHWDKAFETEYPLWRAYHHCVDHGRQRNADRRAKSCQNLNLPDGRDFRFTREGRTGLDPKLLAHIRLRAPSSPDAASRATQAIGCLSICSTWHILPHILWRLANP